MRTRGAGAREAVVELGGQGPLASSPWSVSTPSPSCPSPLKPQHLRVASSCGEKQSRITDQQRSVGPVFHPRASGALILNVVIDQILA